MKVCLLYLPTGVGHFREVYSIKKGLTAKGYEVDVVDLSGILTSSTRKAYRNISGFYNYMIKKVLPVMEKIPTTKFIPRNPLITPKVLVVRVFFSMARTLEFVIGYLYPNIVNVDLYDRIISTHPVLTGYMAGVLKRKGKTADILLNVCPDEVGSYAASFYAIPGVKTTVNTERVSSIISKLYRNSEEVVVSGHPMDPDLFENRQDIYERVQGDIENGKLSIGLYIGGFGPRSQKQGIKSVINELSPLVRNGTIELTVLTGMHRSFGNEVKDLLNKNGIAGNVVLISSTDYESLVRVGHQLIKNKINIMFSRPSELVFYSLVSGVVHITFPPFGPQEVDMLQLLKDSAGVREYKDLEGELAHYLQQKDVLLETSRKLFNSGYRLDGVSNIVKELSFESSILYEQQKV